MAIEILMPALSPTMTEGKLAKWLVKEGDTVKAGDIIAEIETDKATMEVEAVDEGTIAKILVADGTDNVAVNTPIALIATEGEDAKAVTAPAAKAAPAPKAAEPVPAAPVATPAAPVAATPAPATGTRVFASPLARRIAKDSGVDLAAVKGSGPHGRIVKADVETAAKTPRAAAPVAAPAVTPTPAAAPKPAPAALPFPEGSYDVVPNDGMRKTVARRLSEAKQTIPHFYLTIDCELDALLALRTNLNAKSPVKISVNDFIVRACALALKKVPAANASWTDEAILRHKHADVAVAVAIDGGLITPIVFNAEAKGLAAIATETKDLAERARTRKLKPQEYQGGTFSISNLGMFGIKEFAAVVNPPHGAILAIGMGEKRPIVKDGALAIATLMTVTLSCDHRVVDGAVGSQLLAAFKGLIEDPITMML
jgi:pyruvate dehydrogenase E2 component (dihydrolipoamide acetyltransferase)